MSEESILDHGYIPEEHAPDPVISHGDPTPPGKIAIWLFLASEIMFFIGVLGSYIVLRSGSPALFSKHAQALSKPLAGINTIVLILSSVTMYIGVDAAHAGKRNRALLALCCTIVCGLGFMSIKAIEYTTKFKHHTIVMRESPNAPLYVLDGHVYYNGSERVLEGFRAKVPETGFNINLVADLDVKHWQATEEGLDDAKKLEGKEYPIPAGAIISQDINYGPWKNIFYASYFATTGVHAAHVIGGLIALSFLVGHLLRGKILPAHTEYVGLYWHFVDLVWIFLFPLLYLI